MTGQRSVVEVCGRVLQELSLVSPDVKLLQLLALNYYVCGWAIAFFGDSAIKDKMLASDCGPVYPYLLSDLSSLGNGNVTIERYCELASWAPDETGCDLELRSLIRQVIQVYSDYEWNQLWDWAVAPGSPCSLVRELCETEESVGRWIGNELLEQSFLTIARGNQRA